MRLQPVITNLLFLKFIFVLSVLYSSFDSNKQKDLNSLHHIILKCEVKLEYHSLLCCNQQNFCYKITEINFIITLYLLDPIHFLNAKLNFQVFQHILH